MGLKWVVGGVRRARCLVRLGLIIIGTACIPLPATAGAPEQQAATVDTDRASFFRVILDDLETEFTLATGLRQDKFKWSIAGNGTNVLSELSWSGIDSVQISLANRSRYKRHIVLRGHFNYAEITDGRVRDSDYGLDDRDGEYSRSVSDTTGDQLWDLSLGGGYAFYFLRDRLTIAPMIGLAYNKQNFRIENGVQRISADNPYSDNPDYDPPPVGPLSSRLNSTYFARWMGPWIGCDLCYRVVEGRTDRPSVDLGLAFELHWADYYGEGNWNLRDDLEHPKSFEHEATGFGVRVAGDVVVQFADRWSATLSVEIRDWSTRDGTDRVFQVGEPSSERKLNGVDWTTSSFMIGATYRF